MLDKRAKNILWIIAAAMLLLLVSETTRPKPLDWRPNYTDTGKMPLGAYILNEERENLFPDTKIVDVEIDPFEFLIEENYWDEKSAYLFIDQNVFFDEQQVSSLLDYAWEGNTVFISARNVGYILRDSLGIDIDVQYNDLIENEVKPELFSDYNNRDTTITFTKNVFKNTFSSIDTSETRALGFINDEEFIPQESLNYIKVIYGDGQFLLHLLPESFSNYYLLEGNQKYAEKVLSYIDADRIYWDQYLKSGRRVVRSKLRFILNEGALKWAYYVSIAGLLFFIIFTAKREQRAIEVIAPLENTSVEFTKVIGHLYLQNKDYSNLIAKKITYFLETIRSKYYLNTEVLDSRFMERLSQKTGNDLQTTQQLIELIKHLKGKTIHSEEDMIQLHKTIEDFKL